MIYRRIHLGKLPALWLYALNLTILQKCTLLAHFQKRSSAWIQVYMVIGYAFSSSKSSNIYFIRLLKVRKPYVDMNRSQQRRYRRLYQRLETGIVSSTPELRFALGLLVNTNMQLSMHEELRRDQILQSLWSGILKRRKQGTLHDINCNPRNCKNCKLFPIQ